MARPISILLHSESDRRVAQWAEQLSDSQFVLVEADEPFDILLTDGSEPRSPSLHGADSRDVVGVIAFDCDAECDVSLPADCAPRELRLACRMLSQIVRLRRKAQEAARMQSVLRRLAATDPLTGLANLRVWREELQRRVAEKQPFCLAILDLDRFKSVNERHGHLAGDEVLRRLARRLREATPPDCLTARVGGDEFGMLLSAADGQAEQVVQRAREALADDPEAARLGLSASAGMVVSGGSGWALDELQRQADAALREAKNAGGGQLRVCQAVE